MEGRTVILIGRSPYTKQVWEEEFVIAKFKQYNAETDIFQFYEQGDPRSAYKQGRLRTYKAADIADIVAPY